MAACASSSSSSGSASTGTSRAAELPPPSPEFSQAATLKSFREAGKLGDGSSEAGKLGGLTLRSEGKVIKQSQTFSLTLQVEEPSVLAFRWSSVTDGPLHFSAAITGADVAAQHRSPGWRMPPPSPPRSPSQARTAREEGWPRSTSRRRSLGQRTAAVRST